MKKGSLLSALGMLMSIFGMTLFEEQPFWKFFFLVAGVVFAFSGALRHGKEKKRSKRPTLKGL